MKEGINEIRIVNILVAERHFEMWNNNIAVRGAAVVKGRNRLQSYFHLPGIQLREAYF